MQSIHLTCVALLATSLISGAFAPTSSQASPPRPIQGGPDEEVADALLIRTYPVQDLLGYDPHFADPSKQWPGTSLFSAGANGSDGDAGTPGGFGGGMGAAMGGGGMFSIPQGAGGSQGMSGMGGGGMGGMSGMGGGGMSGVSSDPANELLSLIDALIEGEDGFEYNAQISHGLLITRQPAKIHAVIEEILGSLREGIAKQIVVKIEWTALRLDIPTARQLMEAEDPRVIEQAIQEYAVAYGSFSAANGSLVYSTSGEHRNLAIGVTPVVGSFQDGLTRGGGVGYGATTVKPIIGWLAQVRPLVSPDPQRPARLHMAVSQVLPTTGPERIPIVGAVDPGNLPARQLVGTVQTPEREWAVLGGIHLTPLDPSGPTQQDATQPQGVVLVRWSR